MHMATTALPQRCPLHLLQHFVLALKWERFCGMLSAASVTQLSIRLFSLWQRISCMVGLSLSALVIIYRFSQTWHKFNKG